MYSEYGISDKVIKLANKAEEELKDIFQEVDKICQYNSMKVLKAFQKNNIAEMH